MTLTTEKQNEALYESRLKRFNDAVSLNKPDRVPIASHSAYFFYRYAGYSFKDVMYDYEKEIDAVKASVRKFGWDLAPSVPAGSGPLMQIYELTQYRWAGYSLPDDHMFQFLEDEYMSADEYDDLFALHIYFPIELYTYRLLISTNLFIFVNLTLQFSK